MKTDRPLLNLKNKKVLVFGLGLLGGGVATTNWLLKEGAKVTITDAKTKEELAPSLKKLRGLYDLSLGTQTEDDIRNNELIVVNPGVPPSNPLIQLAMGLGKHIENDATLFFHRFSKKLVAITGTRGKTTTVNWTNHLLSRVMRSAIAGNSPTDPFLKIADKGSRLDVAVAEVPSFQLEFFNGTDHAPDVAVVTNLYVDHINWHGTQEKYAKAKANIFRNQREGQYLILNADDKWTPFFLKHKPKSYVWFFSASGKLAKRRNGLYYKNESAYYQLNGRSQKVLDLKNFAAQWGEHNVQNLLAAALAAYLAGASGWEIQNSLATLPQVKFRQEVVYDRKGLKIINDTAATSPDGGVAALKRFGGPNTVLITGGTDRQLDFRVWAKELPKHVKPDNVVFLGGSATESMRKLLGKKYAQVPVYDTLKQCLAAALKKTRRGSVIVFSPACKSFEKFKNEYDRGEQFDKLVRTMVAKNS